MGEYPRVWVPVIFSKAITRTQRVFRHGYPPPAGDTTGYPRAQVPAGGSGYHYQYPWYLWDPLVQVRSRTPREEHEYSHSRIPVAVKLVRVRVSNFGKTSTREYGY